MYAIYAEYLSSFPEKYNLNGEVCSQPSFIFTLHEVPSVSVQTSEMSRGDTLFSVNFVLHLVNSSFEPSVGYTLSAVTVT